MPFDIGGSDETIPGAATPIDHRRNHDQILWEQCQQLQTLPLKEGAVLALKWLREGNYVADPVAALRECGFDV